LHSQQQVLGIAVTKPIPVTPTPTPTPTVTWVKARTVNTANGPVDVDVNGIAQDGSRPVAVTANKTTTIPAGFTEGPFPKELEQFFGSSDGVLGYRIETLTDSKGRTYNQLSVATGPNSSKTFGARFTQGLDGKYSVFSSDGGGNNNTANTNIKTSEQSATDALVATGRAER